MINLLIPYDTTISAIKIDVRDPKTDPNLFPPFSLNATSDAKRSAFFTNAINFFF